MFNKLQNKSLIVAGLLGLEFIFSLIFVESFTLILTLLIITLLAGSYFVLDFTFKKEELKDELKFLIIPILFNVGALFFLSGINQAIFSLLLVFFVAGANYYLFIALKRVQNLEEKAAIFQRNVIISISFLALLFSFSVIYKTYVLLSIGNGNIFPNWLVLILVALIFYFVSYFLAWENGMNMKKFFPYNMVGTLLAIEVSYVGLVWVVNYPVFSGVEKAALGGVPLPAVILTIIFYFIWGVITHKMDKSLSRKVMTEYLGMAIIFLLVLLLTASWLPKL